MTSPTRHTDGVALHELFGDLFMREYRTGREDEQFAVERADDLQRILYEMSYAEEARAIIAHLNASDHARTISEVPQCFIGQQAMYEAVCEQRRRDMAAGVRRPSWSFVSTPRPAQDQHVMLQDLVGASHVFML